MNTPLPEPHYFVVVGYDGRETHQPYYLLSDLERYGEAEYKRAIEAAIEILSDTRENTRYDALQEIKKLLEAK